MGTEGIKLAFNINTDISMKNKIIFTAILLVAIIFTICFIFSNSMESIPESQEKSVGVLNVIRPVFEAVFGEGSLTNHLVRKMAHFAEFFLLGAELCCLCVLWKCPLSYAMLGGLLIALSDETIQLFYDRGSQVQDVWLDFSAVVITVLLTYILVYSIAAVKKNKLK